MSDSDIDPPPPPETVEVNIFNQTYRLRSKTGREHVERIARLVDERMRQISSQLTTHDIARVAVLAALNIADEMQNLRDYYEAEIEQHLSRNSEAPAEEATGEAEPNKPQSWFDDFFDVKVEAKTREERLSSQVSAKLQTLRPASPPAMEITSEEDDS